MKDRFIKEIDQIKNDNLRQAALLMAIDAPDYFWKVAASSSGKYHPAISLGEGGLLRHSLMVCAIAKDLLDSEIFIEYSDDALDYVIVASLFHDVIKRGNDDNTEHSVFDHPLRSAEFVREHLIKYNIDEKTINIICGAISSHMGRWTTNKYSDVVLPKPSTNFERLIHTADYIASRKYIKGLDNWNIEKEQILNAES